MDTNRMRETDMASDHLKGCNYFTIYLK